VRPPAPVFPDSPAEGLSAVAGDTRISTTGPGRASGTTTREIAPLAAALKMRANVSL
jgi:hypothetical protein